MINLNLALLFILCVMLCIVSCRQKILRNICIVTLGVLSIVMLIILFTPLSVMRNSALFSVEDSNDYSLEYSDNYTLSLEQDTFYKGNVLYLRGVNEEEINEWLDDVDNKICFKIYDKQDIVYSKSLPKDIDGNTIISFITDWKETNKLPSTHTRYWFLCFYLEWKL